MIKSKWAYNNGKRIMKEALESIKCEPFGFINNKYAEAYNNQLWVKTYANKKQCLNKIEKLKLTNTLLRVFAVALGITGVYILVKQFQKN